MKAAEIIEGLQIIEKSRPQKESGFHVRAEHDEIFAGSLEWPMPEEDQNRMEEIGWSKDEDVDGWRAPV